MGYYFTRPRAQERVFILLICVTIAYTLPVNNVASMTIPEDLDNRHFINDYIHQRQNFIAAEKHMRVGGQIVLNDDETRVDANLMQMKRKEVEYSLKNGFLFPAQESFIRAKEAVEKSDVFKFVKQMPKGAALHLHDVSMVDIDWLVNVTYKDHCYMCYDSDHKISFHFFQTPPANPGCPWKLVSEYRQQASDPHVFDQMLKDSMMLTDDYVDQNITVVWKYFEEILRRASGLITYEPVFRDYFYEALKTFHDDNVQYLENRALLGAIYELDGTQRDADYVMGIYKNVTEEFKSDYPDFTGARIIKTSLRFGTVANILEEVKLAISLMQKYPDHFAGYDLVGQEDPGKTLLYYLQDLLYPSQQHPPASLPYFFHAGETDFQGTGVDDNLVDAVLLNTTRIGHGYAINKHPMVKAAVENYDIAIEVNPISNQVLKLTENLQNHPAAGFIAEGLPVVISSDDPAAWGARGLSHDFYMAFMALAGEDDGLSLLKQLSLNSLMYSSMAQSDKVAAVKAWEVKWNTFIQHQVALLGKS